MKRFYRCLLVGCLCVALGGGCRGPRGEGESYDGEDGVDITRVGTGDDFGMMGDRIEEAGRITTGVDFETVRFAYDSFRVPQSEFSKVEAVAKFMRSSPGVRLICEGHCDERGSRDYNLSLGEHRALAVRAYLIGLGIDSARIQTRSFGEEMPLDAGHNDQAWRVNRRVEFALYRK